jgi:hypothetical protein
LRFVHDRGIVHANLTARLHAFMSAVSLLSPLCRACYVSIDLTVKLADFSFALNAADSRHQAEPDLGWWTFALIIN